MVGRAILNGAAGLQHGKIKGAFSTTKKTARLWQAGKTNQLCGDCNVADADVFECDGQYSAPQTLGIQSQQLLCRAARKQRLIASDRFLQAGCQKPGIANLKRHKRHGGHVFEARRLGRSTKALQQNMRGECHSIV